MENRMKGTLSQDHRLMRRLFSSIGCALVVLLMTSSPALAQSGRIAGVVTDTSGEPLPGVNVVIVGTNQGTASNMDGFYDLLNVEVGSYTLRASFIGFAPKTFENVRVNINLTTTLNIELQEEAFGMDEVVVTAQQPIVRPDISANVANLSASDMENIPVASLEDVIGLQAGVEAGLSIRGSGSDQVMMNVDGASMRDGRSNQPFTAISYTSIREVQVQTGGFNAEFGNVRSGLINVVTKDGPRNRYSFDILTRYSPAQRKYFGMLPNDPNSYYMRPFLDPAVRDVGTLGGCDENDQGCIWDPYIREQYRNFEDGYIQKAVDREETPEELKEIFEWWHRRPVDVVSPDYQLDGGFGGPVPLVSKALGDLRFWASYRQTQSAYVIPLFPRDAYEEQTARIKLTSDVAPGMKLSVDAMRGLQQGINSDDFGGPGLYTGEMPDNPWSRRGLLSDLNTKVVFTGVDRQMVMDDVTRTMFGARLTHALSRSTFYEVGLQRLHSAYDGYHQPYRDTTTIGFFGPRPMDATPIGLKPWSRSDPSSGLAADHSAEDLDSSRVAVYTGSFQLTSQLNRYLQFKTGVDFIRSNYNMLHGKWRSGTPHPDKFMEHWLAQTIYRWERSPIQGAAFAQSKLEFQGMIANVGLRLDYFNPNSEWYSITPFDSLLSGVWGERFVELAPTERTERRITLSPRVGVSFPITTNNKLYFNYGHFRQMLTPTSIFQLRQLVDAGSRVTRLGNPNHPMPLTVSYELGYEHNLFNRFLLRVTGYYKALEDQPRNVQFNKDGIYRVDYSFPLPYNYADVRGAEFMLRKTYGRWFRGFVNYTYMVRKGGNFGYGEIYHNPTAQQNYLMTSTDHYQSRPRPQPYARANLEFFLPKDFGPEVGGMNLLGDWRIVTLLNWRSGNTFTWTGPRGSSIPGLQSNVRTRNYYMADLRLTKNFETTMGSVQFFADFDNVLNLKFLHVAGGGSPPFSGTSDWESYLASLHLSKDTFKDIDTGRDPYLFVYGNDRPGDYRKDHIEFHPIEVFNAVEEISIRTALERPLYYVRDGQGGGTYYWLRNGEIRPADESFVNWVLDNKAYIDMPNIQSFRFLNPRRVNLGLRLTF
jgi:hypothetical protein